MIVTNVGVLDRVLWPFFDRLESISVGIDTSVLQVTPPDFVPIDITGFLEILTIGGVKLLKTVSGETADAVKGNVAVQARSFVGTKKRVNSTCECEWWCL